MNELNQRPCPETNLIWAILCTVMCCLPLGIVAIMKATSVESLWREGRYYEAEKAAADAKKFSLWGAIAAIVGVVIYFVMYFGFLAILIAAEM